MKIVDHIYYINPNPPKREEIEKIEKIVEVIKETARKRKFKIFEDDHRSPQAVESQVGEPKKTS